MQPCTCAIIMPMPVLSLLVSKICVHIYVITFLNKFAKCVCVCVCVCVCALFMIAGCIATFVNVSIIQAYQQSTGGRFMLGNRLFSSLPIAY